MLQLVLGRSGSGKTKYLLDMAAARARSGESTVLMVPEQFSFETERAILRLLGPHDASRVEVLSFTRLLDSFRRAYGGRGLDPVSEAERALLMSRSVHTVIDHLDVYAKVRIPRTLFGNCSPYPHDVNSPAFGRSSSARFPDRLKGGFYRTSPVSCPLFCKVMMHW